MALYHKWDVKNGFGYVLQFFSLISDGLGGVGASNENYLFSQFGASEPTEGFTQSLVSQEPPPRQTQNKKVKHNFCVFCKKNGENASYYLSHTMKDDNGRVICPILYRHSEPKLRILFEKYLRKPIMNSSDYFTNLLPRRAIEKESKLLIDQKQFLSSVCQLRKSIR